MIKDYIRVNRALRAVHAAAQEFLSAEHFDRDGFGPGVAITFMNRALSDLKQAWPKGLSTALVDELTVQVQVCKFETFGEIVSSTLPKIEDQVDEFFDSKPTGDIDHTVLDLLHPRIVVSSYDHFRAGRFREAVLNGMVTVFDFIRERVGADKDGSALVADAFSVEAPKLVFSSLETESGRNEQKGFFQIFQGAYLGIRNPKAHSLNIKTNKEIAAQYLVLASILCRKVEDAKKLRRVPQKMSGDGPTIRPN